ncbi:hypothetical protein RvVAR0630_31100 [Agrobacterium vitis]|nr:hypothetical protein RvVAR0630_31100 [Agrobacterium vitis]
MRTVRHLTSRRPEMLDVREAGWPGFETQTVDISIPFKQRHGRNEPWQNREARKRENGAARART